jgi:hypothetical protein
MRYSEKTLMSWTAPLSKAEDDRAENTIKMVTEAIKENDELKGMDIEVFTQGSFANNTNVRSDSDVDVCVMLKDVFHCEYAKGKTGRDYNFSNSSFTFDRYRSLVKSALQEKFNADYVHDGNKSLKINENTYHVQADVVPAFQLRNYYYHNSVDCNKFIEGTYFLSSDNTEVENYPKVHKENGITKNKRTNYNYKKLVRILKHIKNNMVDDHKAKGDVITSFLVECLVYHVPDEIIYGIDTWTATVAEAIAYLYDEIKNNRHEEWREVSDMLYLFHRRKWTDWDVRQWLIDAYNYLGY